MAAKGTNGRGGNANGKKYEARRHGGNGGGKGKRRRASASRVEKAHETVERRAGKAAIVEALEPARPYKGLCCECGSPAPIGLYQCDDCHKRQPGGEQ